ncbi:hypothetical protein FRC0295_00106 [Corynebacterium diphtheriae]|nr:hypothetical protein FRC0295_00106 [Corynebacterium diphtheriae]
MNTMSIPVYEAARREAQQILKAMPIDMGLECLKDIAARWNATVSVVPLEEGLSGFIIKESGTDPRIYLNALESQQRQRFTLAHEIGHLVEREAISGDRDYSFIDYRHTDKRVSDCLCAGAWFTSSPRIGRGKPRLVG